MDNVFVSVHIIVKETTNYGRMLFESSLKSFLRDNKGYADEVVVYDDGCSSDVRYMYHGMLKSSGVQYCFYGDTKERTFAEKRNVCLLNTDKRSTHIHWIDSDDIYYPDTMLALKNSMLKSADDCGKFINYFCHCMGDPWNLEDIYPKDNIFRYNSDLKWVKGVHEKLENVVPDKQCISGLRYYHAGYTRSVIATAIKWIHYSVLEEKPNHYLHDNEPMYRLGLHKIIDDRLEKRKLIANDQIPSAFQSIISHYRSYGFGESRDFNDWQRFVNNVDGIYCHWFQQYEGAAKQDGNWSKFIQFVIDNKLWEVY
jgi:hypothetical protein